VFQGASVGFNTALAATLPGYAAPTTSVTYFDAFALQTAMTANPAAYGLTNVTSACYDGQVDGSPTPALPL
jgi:phospholipase/lecithinase/hemolysin